MFGYFSQIVDRSESVRTNAYFVYDITILEWEKRTVLQQDGRVYLCKGPVASTYEIICKRDFCYILVLFTSQRAILTERLFDIFKTKVNALDPSLPWLHKSHTVAIYKQVNRAIQANSGWTATHIAAKIGLDVYFDGANEHIYEDMDQQAMPDMMTSLHLAIQNGHLNVVRALVEHGGSLDLVDICGFNALHFAAISTPEILMFILSLPGMFERAKVKTKKRCTPLHLASYARKLENINIFLRFGLSVSMLSLLPPVDHSSCPFSQPPARTSLRSSASKRDDPIVKLSEEQIDEFDIEILFYGGTPLHWTKKQCEVEQFLALGFDIDAPNVKGQTALILKTQRMRFKCLLCLLCHGANTALADMNGDTALGFAIHQGDITIAQALAIFDSDIDHVNRAGDSIRHLTSTLPGESINHKMLLYVLSSLGAKRCPPNKAGCSDGCSASGTFNGKRFIRWPVFTGRKFYANCLLKDVIKQTKAKIQSKKGGSQEANLINMVSFDGGGVKGLITIQMIHELQKRLKRPFIEYFDWIAGTSTGSIIALCLILGKSTAQVRSTYFRFKDKIMTGSRPYSSEKLEALLREELGTVKMVDLYETYHKYVLIPGTLVDRLPVQLHLFRSFPSAGSILGERCKVVESQFPPLADYREQVAWEAVRASAAAPTYFNSFGRCVDGGILSNNPTMDLMVEFNNYNYALRRKKRLAEVRKVNAVVSFGTGQVARRQFSLPELSKFISWNPREMTSNLSYFKEFLTIIIDSACNTDYHVVERNESWCASNNIPMFRLNPELIEVMSLNEVEDGEIINSLYLTKVYMYSKKDAIEELITFLENVPADRPFTPPPPPTSKTGDLPPNTSSIDGSSTGSQSKSQTDG